MVSPFISIGMYCPSTTTSFSILGSRIILPRSTGCPSPVTCTFRSNGLKPKKLALTIYSPDLILAKLNSPIEFVMAYDLRIESFAPISITEAPGMDSVSLLYNAPVILDDCPNDTDKNNNAIINNEFFMSCV